MLAPKTVSPGPGVSLGEALAARLARLKQRADQAQRLARHGPRRCHDGDRITGTHVSDRTWSTLLHPQTIAVVAIALAAVHH